MKNRILNNFGSLIAAVLIAVSLTGCSKLRAGETFIASAGGVEFQYEVIVSYMNYVRVYPVSGRISGDIVIPSVVPYDNIKYVVTQVGQNAFRDCSAITSVTLPETLSTIEASAFEGCSSLRRINTPQPLSVIGDYAFSGCVSLREFSLDASISTLGKGCFRGCSALTAVKFPTSFTEIPDEAFFGCAGLGEIICPSTVMRIGADAFGGCIGVRKIYLDSSVQSIGSRAFAGCFGVASITCFTPTPPVCSADTFDGIPVQIPVTVMASSVENYWNAPGWNRFENIRGVY